MFIVNFDPVAFQIFSFEIRWYSLSYIFGIIIGWMYCKKVLIHDQKIFKLFDDLILYLILGILIGGRLGYVFFYNPLYYSNNLVEIFKLWEGGMSFHGGLIGVIIATSIFSSKNKINSFLFLDLIAMTAPIGIFLGRISNFINSELYGRKTDFLFGMKFEKVDNIVRHPSQLYEAFFEGVILFVLLNFVFKKYLYKKTGVLSSLFLIFYSLFRFMVEYTREPDEHLGIIYLNLTLGQVISVITLIIGIGIFLKVNEKKE